MVLLMPFVIPCGSRRISNFKGVKMNTINIKHRIVRPDEDLRKFDLSYIGSTITIDNGNTIKINLDMKQVESILVEWVLSNYSPAPTVDSLISGNGTPIVENISYEAVDNSPNTMPYSKMFLKSISITIKGKMEFELVIDGNTFTEILTRWARSNFANLFEEAL